MYGWVDRVIKCFKRWSIYYLFWEPVPNSDSTDVEGVAEVVNITLWLAVHAIVPWVGYDCRGKGMPRRPFCILQNMDTCCASLLISNVSHSSVLTRSHELIQRSQLLQTNQAAFFCTCSILFTSWSVCGFHASEAYSTSTT